MLGKRVVRRTDELLHAELGEEADGVHDRRERVPFVRVELLHTVGQSTRSSTSSTATHPSQHRDDWYALALADEPKREGAAVSLDGVLPKPGKRIVRDLDDVTEALCEGAEAGAADDTDARGEQLWRKELREGVESLSEGRHRGRGVRRERGWHRHGSLVVDDDDEQDRAGVDEAEPIDGALRRRGRDGQAPPREPLTSQ